jgi:nicotinamide riboside kinase
VDAIGRADKVDLYLLCEPDFPFVQDGWRDGEHLRSWMTQRFRERIRGPWIEVRGSVSERVDQVLARMFSRT